MADNEKSVAAQVAEKVETASESAAPAADDVKMDDAPSASNDEAADKAASSEGKIISPAFSPASQIAPRRNSPYFHSIHHDIVYASYLPSHRVSSRS